MHSKNIKQTILDETEEMWGLVCPLCKQGYVTTLHHIIPRSRTSKKHEAWWLWDKRNLLLICVPCDTAMLHTRQGIIRCIAIQKARHPNWDYSVAPWQEYNHVETP